MVLNLEGWSLAFLISAAFIYLHQKKSSFLSWQRPKIRKTTRDGGTQDPEAVALKQLYYQLHNLEDFPGIIPHARSILLSLLSETEEKASTLPQQHTILSVGTFSRKSLDDFQTSRDNCIGEQWKKYIDRRKRRGPMELFRDRAEAIWWLKQIAPVKYVDGAWLGHIGRVTTPFGLQRIVKGAWQVLSEELGDGDLEKNHVHLYEQLLGAIAPELPTPTELDFIHPRHQLDEVCVWKAALAQLLISLFPHEFLPEILGFNLHFEAISMDTLVAAKELKEVGIDPYYFVLHISIDNADSGHTAIAGEVVCEYMEHVEKTEGKGAADKAWKRIQSGYLLSSGLPGTTACPSRRKASTATSIQFSASEADVIRIFRAKAKVGHQVHCASRAKIGPRTLVDWLDPIPLQSKQWQKDLLCALSSSSYWISKGNSSTSRFMHELSWGGKMFGSFTHDECEVVKRWIDDMPCMSASADSLQGQESPSTKDVRCEYPVFVPQSSLTIHKLSSRSDTLLFSFCDLPPFSIETNPVEERLLPIWFSHPCLLQGFTSVPFRTNNKIGSAVVKVLRAQGGFDIQRDCVAGMDEVRRSDSISLLDVGLRMSRRYGLADAISLKDILEARPSEFATEMLHISMRPVEYKGLLIGMATAFAKMHAAMAASASTFAIDSAQVGLLKIAQRELAELECCWYKLEADREQYGQCCNGYVIALGEIQRCFKTT